MCDGHGASGDFALRIDPLRFARLVDPALRERSGKVFYSGRAAFARPSKLYLLGLNPGGSPIAQADETIGRNLARWEQGSERWSEYLDESWRGAAPGSYGMAPRILHLFDRLGLDPADVPASNVIFARSAREADIAAEADALLETCWRVHAAVIEALGVTTITCLGGRAGRWVRAKIGAHEKIGGFVEANARRWTSEAHVGRDRISVVTLTHPSIADWRNPAADPTALVCDLLKG